MRRDQHRSAVAIGLNVVALTVCLAYADGCGSGRPSSFPDVPDVQVPSDLAALPAGWAIKVRLGPDHEAEAAIEAGAFHAEVLAPEEPGDYVAHVRAFGGSIPSRTAALTVVEVGVRVQ